MKSEPVLILNAVKALIALAVVFGLQLPAGADVAILVALEAVVQVFVRSRVTPTGSVT